MAKTKQEELAALYQEASNGDTDALNFIVAWGDYVHGIDDLIDGDIPLNANRTKVKLFFEACRVYSSNYWMKYNYALYMQVALISCDYADSNEPNMPNAQFLASSGNNMIKAVAFLQGGYELLERISGKLNKLSALEHSTQGEQ